MNRLLLLVVVIMFLGLGATAVHVVTDVQHTVQEHVR
jgi:hypothetical protein